MSFQSNIIKKYIFFIVIFCFFISCAKKDEKVPDGIISLDEMSEILADVHIAEAYVNYKNLPAEQMKLSISSYYKFIFKNHNITEEVFQESLDYYSKHPALFEKVYAKTIDKLSREEAESVRH